MEQRSNGLQERSTNGARPLDRNGGGGAPIRVGIIDTSELLREGLVALFNGATGYRCVGAWGEVNEAMEAVRQEAPDVILLDVKLPEQAGFAALEELSAISPRTHIIVTVDCREERCVVLNPQSAPLQHKPLAAVSQTFSAPDDCLQIALKLGAHGVVRKQCSFSYLAQAIRTVQSGQYWMELPTATRLAQQYLLSVQPLHAPGETGARSLTLRERQVVTLIAQGRSNKEIARELQLAYSTVKNYVSSILEKLELSDRTQIALYAIEQTPVEREPETVTA